jgi:hypothetical protein
MKKHNFFGVFALMFAMLNMYIDAGDGAGGDTGDDIGDFDIGDGAGSGDGDVGDNLADAKLGAKDNLDEPTITPEELTELKQMREEYARDKYFKGVVDEIKADMPDFDASKVVAKLKSINEKDPKKAEKYNNEAGFRLLWREMSDDAAKNDAVNGGSNKGGESNFDSILDGAMQQKDGALRKAISMAL